MNDITYNSTKGQSTINGYLRYSSEPILKGARRCLSDGTYSSLLIVHRRRHGP